MLEIYAGDKLRFVVVMEHTVLSLLVILLLSFVCVSLHFEFMKIIAGWFQIPF